MSIRRIDHLTFLFGVSLLLNVWLAAGVILGAWVMTRPEVPA